MNTYNLKIYLVNDSKLYCLKLNKIQDENYTEVFFRNSVASHYDQIMDWFFCVLESKNINIISQIIIMETEEFLSINFTTEEEILSTIFEENNEL